MKSYLQTENVKPKRAFYTKMPETVVFCEVLTKACCRRWKRWLDYFTCNSRSDTETWDMSERYFRTLDISGVHGVWFETLEKSVDSWMDYWKYFY